MYLLLYTLIINLLIAHSHPHFLLILQNILRSYHGFNIIGKATNAAELQRIANSFKPDIIIADIALPGMKGYTALQKLAVSGGPPKVIISWRHHHRRIIKKAIDAGCAACIVHDADPADYQTAIKEIMKGKVFYCSQTEKVLQDTKNMQDGGDAAGEIHNETYRIIAYCKYLGFSSKGTAMATGLSKKTVDTYRLKLNRNVGSSSFAALESYLKENGML